MRQILFVICALASFSLAADDTVKYPGPTRSLLCQYFESGLGIYFNHEVRLSFETPTDVDVTLGLGLTVNLPRTLCMRNDSYLQLVHGSGSIYTLKGDLTCLYPKDKMKDSQPQCESSTKTIDATFDLAKMTMTMDKMEFNCTWLPDGQKH